jgi:hypothetical protein
MGRGGTRGSLSVGCTACTACAGSGPEQLPWLLAEARRCEGFVAREDAFGIARPAVPRGAP